MQHGQERMQRVVDRTVARATWDTATHETAPHAWLDERPARVHIWQVVFVLVEGLDDVVSRQVQRDEQTPADHWYLCALRELASEVRDYLRDGDEQADFERRRREFA
jgi:hypothetical protein